MGRCCARTYAHILQPNYTRMCLLPAEDMTHAPPQLVQLDLSYNRLLRLTGMQVGWSPHVARSLHSLTSVVVACRYSPA